MVLVWLLGTYVFTPDQVVSAESYNLIAEHSRFREAFFSEIRAAAPNAAEPWIRQHDPKSRGA